MRAYITGLALTAMIALATVSQAFAYERWLDVHNSSSDTIEYFYMTHVDDGDWGPDLFGDYVLDPGEQIRIDPGFQNGYCRMDWKAVWYDGSYDTGRIDACSKTDLYLYD